MMMTMKMEMREEERWKRHDTKFLINTQSLSLKLCGFVFHSLRMTVDEAMLEIMQIARQTFHFFLRWKDFYAFMRHELIYIV